MTPPATLYDIGTVPAPVAGTIQAGVGGCLVGVLLLYLVWRHKDRSLRVFAALWIAGWGLFSVVTGLGIVSRHRLAQEWLRTGDVEVAEGDVKDFSPATGNRTQETFRIGTKIFILEDGGTTVPGLNKASVRGGPVSKDARLRVTYHGKSILRVEEPAAPPATTKPGPG
jgi:hypothetical protein